MGRRGLQLCAAVEAVGFVGALGSSCGFLGALCSSCGFLWVYFVVAVGFVGALV